MLTTWRRRLVEGSRRGPVPPVTGWRNTPVMTSLKFTVHVALYRLTSEGGRRPTSDMERSGVIQSITVFTQRNKLYPGKCSRGREVVSYCVINSIQNKCQQIHTNTDNIIRGKHVLKKI